MLQVLSDVSTRNMKGFHCKDQNSTNSADDLGKYDGHVAILVISIVFLILGVFGNIAVVVYNVCLNRDKTASSWFVTHLAVADLFVCITVYATKMVRFFIFRSQRMCPYKATKHLYRHINKTALYVSLFLSLAFLVAITIDRYLFIAKPLKYPLIVTKRRTFLVIRSIWVAALLQAPLVYFFISQLGQENRPWLYIIQAVLNAVYIVVIIILNYKIFKIVKEQRKRIELQPQPAQPEDSLEQQRQSDNNLLSKPYVTWLSHLAKELKDIKTFAMIVVVLTCCFLPYNVINIYRPFAGRSFRQSNKMLWYFVLQLVGMNSIANPFIYVLRHKNCRKAFRELFSSVWEQCFGK